MDSYRTTIHKGYFDTYIHACDEDNPCGDITLCHYCRYRQENKMEYFNTWYAVMQYDAMAKKYVELVKRPHKHLCYEYINKSNLRNTKVVAFYWQE